MTACSQSNSRMPAGCCQIKQGMAVIIPTTNCCQVQGMQKHTPGPGTLPGCLYESSTDTLPPSTFRHTHICQVSSIVTVACRLHSHIVAPFVTLPVKGTEQRTHTHTHTYTHTYTHTHVRVRSVMHDLILCLCVPVGQLAVVALHMHYMM